MEDFEAYRRGYNDYGIRVDIFLPPDSIKPYHIKESILSLKEAKELRKKIDANTKMTGPYKLDNLYFDLFDDKPKEKKLKKNKNLVLIFIYNFY